MSENEPKPDLPSDRLVGMDTTASLLEQIRHGDRSARDDLAARFLPRLQRWARGRLPSYVRDINDTDDLVQVTMLRALDHLEEFEQRKEGAFLAYLRRILLNQIRDEIRRTARRPPAQQLPEEVRDRKPSPLEAAIGREQLEAYEKALATLTEREQEAFIMRMELGFSHPEVAESLGFASANAARMAVSRALVRLSEVMHGQ